MRYIDGTFDNQQKQCREVWEGGHLKSFTTREAIEKFSPSEAWGSWPNRPDVVAADMEYLAKHLQRAFGEGGDGRINDVANQLWFAARHLRNL